MIHLTPETAAAERQRILGRLRFHRQEAKRARLALDLLEADCTRVGIRLVREPVSQSPKEAETHDPRFHRPRSDR